MEIRKFIDGGKNGQFELVLRSVDKAGYGHSYLTDHQRRLDDCMDGAREHVRQSVVDTVIHEQE